MCGVNLQCDTDLYGWNGPMPPDEPAHSYYFLVYEQQTGELSLNETSMYEYSPDSCPERLKGRSVTVADK